MDSADLGSVSKDIANGSLIRPVQLALFADSGIGSIIEVDNLKLEQVSGENLLRNGDFSEGLDFWWPSTEKHNPWHIFNIWVHVLFDMGWLGLLTFICLLFIVYYRLLSALKYDLAAPVILASISGFLIIGYVDSPFDAPRLSLLFLILVFFALFALNKPHQFLRHINR